MPGFYRLALVAGQKRRVVDGLTVAVLVPFKEKEGAMLNGYRIGTYLAEKIEGNQEPPEGFLEINEQRRGSSYQQAPQGRRLSQSRRARRRGRDMRR